MRTALAVLLFAPLAAPALGPAGVFVVYNSADPRSKGVADHYAAKRGVPAGNLIGLPLPGSEDISRADYDAKLAAPLRVRLAPHKDVAKCLLTVWGVPLRVGPMVLTEADRAAADKVQTALAEAKQAGDAPQKVAELEQKLVILSGDQSMAAVDSELMLLWWGDKYPLARWAFNPLYWRIGTEDWVKAPPVLLTCRLDGPSPVLAKRLVDDALAVEAAGGPTGKAYVDARGLKFDPKKPDTATGYEGYDESFREAADLLKKGGFDTVLDDKEPVFGPGTCPDAALYTGWYSLGNYIPSLTLNRGAVAWHLASNEAGTLRDRDSKLWCPRLLMDGAAVTLGPVAEPYTVGFPKPAEFFGFLLTGRYTVAECYARTILLTSWQIVLVGDPLYNPFKNKPRLKEADVFPSPKGTK